MIEGTILRRVGTGTGADGAAFSIAGQTQVDASNITSAGPTQSGQDVTFLLDANTISDTPSTAAYIQRPITDVFGAVSDVDVIDIIRIWARLSAAPVVTDLHVGVAIVTADDSRGLAVRLAAIGGLWVAQHSVNVASSWAAWTTSTGDATTRGVVGQGGGGVGSATGTRWGAISVTDLGVRVATAAAGTTPSSPTVGNDLTHLRLFVGWQAGGIGTPAPVTIRGGAFLEKLLQIPAYASCFRP